MFINVVWPGDSGNGRELIVHRIRSFTPKSRSSYESSDYPNRRWLPENSSAMNAESILDVSSASRKIVKKIIYRLAKELSKTCPHPGICIWRFACSVVKAVTAPTRIQHLAFPRLGTKGSEVNAWYNDGCQQFFDKHPNLNRKGVASYIRSCGLGFYHGCLRRKFSNTKMLKKSSVGTNAIPS